MLRAGLLGSLGRQVVPSTHRLESSVLRQGSPDELILFGGSVGSDCRGVLHEPTDWSTIASRRGVVKSDGSAASRVEVLFGIAARAGRPSHALTEEYGGTRIHQTAEVPDIPGCSDRCASSAITDSGCHCEEQSDEAIPRQEDVTEYVRPNTENFRAVACKRSEYCRRTARIDDGLIEPSTRSARQSVRGSENGKAGLDCYSQLP